MMKKERNLKMMLTSSTNSQAGIQSEYDRESE